MKIAAIFIRYAFIYYFFSCGATWRKLKYCAMPAASRVEFLKMKMIFWQNHFHPQTPLVKIPNHSTFL
jgi:hypothetical protein